MRQKLEKDRHIRYFKLTCRDLTPNMRSNLRARIDFLNDKLVNFNT